jgi:diguanylate cyclase (GGDEF)-like protein
MESEVAYAVRHGKSVAVVLFDIDHFKRVNDTHGHPAGDRVLCHVAESISRWLRSEDLLARYGGEEFVALLRGADVRAAYQMAERMRVLISERPALVEGKSIPVTISAGCAALGCTNERVPEALLAVSDRRLYAAKRAGRNRVVWSD